jgi:N6-adenosine-specific RNA methylase IME4
MIAPTFYHTISIDVPWPERGGGKIKRGADRHYDLLHVRDVVPTIRGSGMFNPAFNSHLYFWVTNNYLVAGIDIIEELGFRYITTITWAKAHFGIGQYFRGQTEHLLFAVRGKGLALRRAHTDVKNISTLLTADWERDSAGKVIHSAKPEAAYQLMETCSPEPRLDMFARKCRPGWDVWGNEV